MRLVTQGDDGLLNIHKDNKSVDSSRLFSGKMGMPVNSVVGSRRGYGAGFTIYGEGNSKQQRRKKQLGNNQTVIVIKNGSKGRGKKRKQRRQDWTLF